MVLKGLETWIGQWIRIIRSRRHGAGGIDLFEAWTRMKYETTLKTFMSVGFYLDEVDETPRW